MEIVRALMKMSLRVNLVTNPSPQTSRGIGKGGGGRMNLGTKGYYLCTLYALEGGGGGGLLDAVYRGLLLMYTVCT